MIVSIVLYLLPAYILYKILLTYNRLASIPGPLLNKFTNLPRLWSVYRRNPHNDQLALHRKHGDLVRLGPDMISVSGPDYIPQIYGIGKGLVKSDFYAVFQNIVNGQRAASLVAMTDETQHAKTKRQIAHAYSLSTLVEFEPLVDSTTEVFLETLEQRFARTGKQCDLGRWLQFYAFDVIGELTFSKRLGFIETGEDVSNIIHSIGLNFDYFSVLGQMPWLDEVFLGKSPLYIKFFSKPIASPILKFAQQLLQERLDEMKKRDQARGGRQNVESVPGDRPDFLTRFLQTRKENQNEEPLSDRQMLSLLFMNINAGSDTIASTLRAIMYYLLTNPSTLKTLTHELETAHKAGHLTLPCPTWQETQSEQHTPYLRAVIKEGLRLNPALSLPLERVVPKEGMVLNVSSSPSSSSGSRQDSIPLPPNTIIGINPYVLHRDPQIFSPDPDTFNPSRWLLECPSPFDSPPHENNAQRERRLKQMDSHILTFGAGKRTCMGKNIAMLELSKIVPALLMRFDFSFSSSSSFPSPPKGGGKKEEEKKVDWKVRNSWVLGHEGLVVGLKVRER